MMTAVVVSLAVVGGCVGDSDEISSTSSPATSSPATSSPTSSTSCVPPVIGHRGEPDAAPEETIESFTAAVDHGALTLEGDVLVTKDGTPVMLHDRTLDRTTNGSGPLADTTAAEVRALDAGSWLSPEWEGTRVPTLEEFLDLAESREVKVLLELREGISQADVSLVLDMIHRRHLGEATTVQSFDASVLKVVKDADPEMSTAIITPSALTPEVARASGSSIVAKTDVSTTQQVAAWQAAGLSVFVWTANTESEWLAAARAGVDGVITDRTADYQSWATDYCR